MKIINPIWIILLLIIYFVFLFYSIGMFILLQSKLLQHGSGNQLVSSIQFNSKLASLHQRLISSELSHFNSSHHCSTCCIQRYAVLNSSIVITTPQKTVLTKCCWIFLPQVTNAKANHQNLFIDINVTIQQSSSLRFIPQWSMFSKRRFLKYI